MNRAELIIQIADLKKRKAIKNAQLLWIERSTNWQRDAYNGTQEELFNIMEKLDQKMDEYYYSAKSELSQLDQELKKTSDALLADPFNYSQLIVFEKETKAKRMELWQEMKSVLWTDQSCIKRHLSPAMGQFMGVDAACNSDDFTVITKFEGHRVVDWEVVSNASNVLNESEKTEAVRKEAHNG